MITISIYLMLLITIAGRFGVFNPTHKLGYRLPTTARSSTKSLRSHTVLSFTRGRGSIPTRGTEQRHGGTDDTDITRNFLPAE